MYRKYFAYPSYKLSVPKTDFIFHTSLYLLNKPRKPYSWNWYLTHNINSFDFIHYTAYDDCIGQFDTTIKLFDLISLFNQIQKTLKLEIENIFNRKNLYKCINFSNEKFAKGLSYWRWWYFGNYLGYKERKHM